MNEPRPSPSQPHPPHGPGAQPAHPQAHPQAPTIRPIGAAAAHLPRPAGAPVAAPRRIEPPPPHAVPPVPGALRPGGPPPPPPPPPHRDNDLIDLEEEDSIPLDDGPTTPVAPGAPRLPSAGGGMGSPGAASAGASASAGSTAGGSVQGFANPSKIKFASGGDKHTYTKFKRETRCTGDGACRVRSFHGRLSDDGLAFMDDKINEWLDNHPEIEVKFVNSLVGPLEGKVTGEQGLIVVIWY